jgi:hypothetical protein
MILHSRRVLNAKLLDDSDPQVRLAALLAISEMPASDAAANGVFAMLQKSQNADDRWISDGATTAAARNDAGFIRAVLSNYKPATTASASTTVGNLLPNSSFEERTDGKPTAWRTSTHSGRGELGVADIGHTGVAA